MICFIPVNVDTTGYWSFPVARVLRFKVTNFCREDSAGLKEVLKMGLKPLLAWC